MSRSQQVALHGKDNRLGGIDPIPPGRWQQPGTASPFLNGWTNAGGGLQTFRWRRTNENQTEIQGVVTGGTAQPVINLPDPYRPAEIQYAVNADSDGALLIWTFEPSGDLSFAEAAAGGGASGAAGGVLDGTYPNPGIAASVAGAGLSESTNVLAVNVDNSTVEISSDNIRVKADGITANEIAAGAVGASEIASSGVTAATYGDSTHSPQIAVDVDGRITSASNVSITGAGGIAASDGWIDDTGDTWTYASADAPTFTFTVSGDKTSSLSPGKKLKLTQTTIKYFIVTASSHSGGTTTVTIYGGTDYTLANAAISANYHSWAKAPDGFPTNPAKWTIETTFTNSPAKASPTATTWYGDTGLSPTGPNIVIHIGAWRVYYKTGIGSRRAANGSVFARCTLSTASNSESDAELTSADVGVANTTAADMSAFVEQQLVLAAKTTYYLNAMTTAGSQTNLLLNSQGQTAYIRAVCDYL